MLVTTLLLPLARRLAKASGAMDHPADGKLQTQAVPRMGGVAILAGIATSSSIFLWRGFEQGLLATSARELSALATGCGLVFLIGLFDDIRGASPIQKLLVQIVAAGLLVSVGWAFEAVNLPFIGALDLGALGGLISVIWIVGVTNAINLIDGLDGLAGGVVALVAGTFLILATLQENFFAVILMAAVIGSSLGFLRHNWYPARIFMGDSGALGLGFLLAAVSVQASLKSSATVAVFVPLLALGVPVNDTLMVMGARFMAEPKAPLASRVLRVLRGDRNHLHHRLIRVSASQPKIVLAICGVVLIFCIFSLSVAFSRNRELGLVLLVVEMAAIIALRRFSERSATAQSATLDRERADTAETGSPINQPR